MKSGARHNVSSKCQPSRMGWLAQNWLVDWCTYVFMMLKCHCPHESGERHLVVSTYNVLLIQTTDGPSIWLGIREAKINYIKLMVQILSDEWLAVWPDWAIYWTFGKSSKPLATINLPKSPSILRQFLLWC